MMALSYSAACKRERRVSSTALPSDVQREPAAAVSVPVPTEPRTQTESVMPVVTTEAQAQPVVSMIVAAPPAQRETHAVVAPTHAETMTVVAATVPPVDNVPSVVDRPAHDVTVPRRIHHGRDRVVPVRRVRVGRRIRRRV